MAFSIIKEWLTKCDELRPLDSNYDYRIKSSLFTAMRKQTFIGNEIGYSAEQEQSITQVTNSKGKLKIKRESYRLS